jgi:hypothetical protein
MVKSGSPTLPDEELLVEGTQQQREEPAASIAAARSAATAKPANLMRKRDFGSTTLGTYVPDLYKIFWKF